MVGTLLTHCYINLIEEVTGGGFERLGESTGESFRRRRYLVGGSEIKYLFLFWSEIKINPMATTKIKLPSSCLVCSSCKFLHVFVFMKRKR